MRVPTPLRRRIPRTSWLMVGWLTVVWVLLWGDVTVANVVAGVGVALLVTTLAPLPPVPFEGRIRPWGVVRLVARFLLDLVVASAQVAAAILRGRQPRGAVLRVRLRSHSDLFLTITAGLTSLIPGSIVVEAHRLTGTLYVHIFDVDRHGGTDSVVRTVLEQEERVMRALATNDQLAEAGYGAGAHHPATPVDPGGAD